MITTETIEAEKTEQKINLIDGYFTASEAADIINNVLKVKINFHQVRCLSTFEGNMNDPCYHDNGRIDELLDEQKIAAAFFKDVRVQGKKLKISSTIHITSED